jgi:hypothetical protein
MGMGQVTPMKSIFLGYEHSWLVVWNMNFRTFHILGIIIPTDELIFFRGVGQPPTRFSDRGYFGVIVPQSLWASPWPMAKFLFTMAKLPLLDIEVRKMLHIHPKLFRFYRCYMLLDHWKDPSMNL